MPEASQGRRVWDLSDEMIKERRWSFELALRRELDETDSTTIARKFPEIRASRKTYDGSQTDRPEICQGSRTLKIRICFRKSFP